MASATRFTVFGVLAAILTGNAFVNGDCDAISEEGVFRHTAILSSAVSVPSQAGMQFKCMVFDFPTHDDFHLVALGGEDNSDLLQHIIVYGCNGDDYPELPGAIHTCYLNRECGKILFQWTKGDSDICLHPEAGMRIGNNDEGFKRGMMEFHLLNEGDADAEDQSGMNFYLTPNRRLYDASMFSIGQLTLNIPPGEKDYEVNGGCSADCTSTFMIGPITVTAAFNHMHHMAIAGASQWIEKEPKVNYIANDKTFDYDYTKYHRFEEPLLINPGIRFKMDCHYDTTMHNRTLKFGLNLDQNEMCLGFFMYHPKENMNTSTCRSRGDLDSCDLANTVIRGCNTAVMTFSEPDDVPYYSIVQDYCSVKLCLTECMELLREVKQHPCYSGSVRDHNMGFIDAADPTEKINMLNFWLKMSSCDYEFGRENADIKPIV